jgi:hypothetical protein
MRIHLVSFATLAMVALVTGCAVERTQLVASTSNPCRDPRLMQSCRQVDAVGEVVADDDGDALVGTKGKVLSKSAIERRGAVAVLGGHGFTPPPALSPPPHVPEPKGMRPPPPPRR